MCENDISRHLFPSLPRVHNKKTTRSSIISPVILPGGDTVHKSQSSIFASWSETSIFSIGFIKWPSSPLAPSRQASTESQCRTYCEVISLGFTQGRGRRIFTLLEVRKGQAPSCRREWPRHHASNAGAEMHMRCLPSVLPEQLHGRYFQDELRSTHQMQLQGRLPLASQLTRRLQAFLAASP